MSLTRKIMTRAAVPSPQADERMADVRPNVLKRLGPGGGFVDAIMGGVLEKRRFVGGQGLDAMRSTLSSQLAAGLQVTDTGFSDLHGQTDQLMSAPIFAKAFREAWQMDYVEQTPLFVSRAEPESAARAMHTVASPAVLNFALELESFKTNPSLKAGMPTSIVDDLSDWTYSLNHLMASTPSQFAERVNYLGPMVNVQDRAPHSSSMAVRRGDNAERMLSFSIYDRARIFNMFNDHVVKGDYLFWCVKEQNLDHLREYVDPRGRAVATRRKFPASALQIVGMSQRGWHSPIHNSSYDPTTLNGPLSFTDPRAEDTDFIKRISVMAKDFDTIDCAGLGEEGREVEVRRSSDADRASERARETPQLVYDAYMSGHCMKVGYARETQGRDATVSSILKAHRSHEDMVKLQSLVIYNI